MIYEYKGKKYPDYLKDGNAIKYILPIAEFFLQSCNDVLDIGGTKQWHYPGADYVNIENKNGYHAMQLPKRKYDGIISSHTLEHLKHPEWAINKWTEHLKKDGPLFLYLPHENMEYWAVDCPKHLHTFTPCIISYWMAKAGFENILSTEQDAYWSFMVVGWKK